VKLLLKPKPKPKPKFVPLVAGGLAVVLVSLAVALVGQSSPQATPPASGTPDRSGTPGTRTPGYQGTPRMEGGQTPGYRSTPEMGRPSTPGPGMTQITPSAARTPLR